jgi:hypothetical protein
VPPFVAAYQLHVPEATHHAGTANVTSAITATSAVAHPRLVVLLLIVMAPPRVLVSRFQCTRAPSSGRS